MSQSTDNVLLQSFLQYIWLPIMGWVLFQKKEESKRLAEHGKDIAVLKDKTTSRDEVRIIAREEFINVLDQLGNLNTKIDKTFDEVVKLRIKAARVIISDNDDD